MADSGPISEYTGPLIPTGQEILKLGDPPIFWNSMRTTSAGVFGAKDPEWDREDEEATNVDNQHWPLNQRLSVREEMIE